VVLATGFSQSGGNRILVTAIHKKTGHQSRDYAGNTERIRGAYAFNRTSEMLVERTENMALLREKLGSLRWGKKTCLRFNCYRKTNIAGSLSLSRTAKRTSDHLRPGCILRLSEAQRKSSDGRTNRCHRRAITLSGKRESR